MPESDGEAERIESAYQYAGIPLMPEVIRELILELYAGRIVRRNDIVTKIPEVHTKRGGVEANAANLEASVKKALQYLKREGLATNPGYGMWKIRSADESEVEHELSAEDEPNDSAGVVASAELEFGSGESAIYLYYFKVYQSHPDAKEENRWPCKIGRTDRDPLRRILSQSTTALPEVPHIALVMWTPFPSHWEAALHSILRLRGRSIKTAPGNEWFSTNPTEVLELIRMIDPEGNIPIMS
ncbi:GIY-YIG nuclease family protein [Microcystis wesenbergii FACHB-1317]|uniref:GIY-YIG nuclease family protein n=1 Tax=Microcystis TaxID=1125 RepID=UPI000E38FD83|nr:MULTISPECIES: GIY-YIG nuclease family protein [Microcystis]MBD2287911.1 GIY-YIG nuclease family protein [Microcystis wesenbergii FACHB-1317]REJ46817.1 MAG: GIY-YIG nuclease family protein [Microcystis aeruginosa TA09]UZO75101.1 GIY-YIG nuclease family protein [Microcystis aeruginosa str. Chao 1910]